MPDLTKMGMTKAEIRKEAEEIHNKNVEEIKNTLPPEVSAVFLEAYDNFVEKCYEDTYIADDDNNYLLEYFSLLKEARTWASQGQTRLSMEAERRAKCLLNGNIRDYEKFMLADAQTSGGLLISASNSISKKLIDKLNNKSEYGSAIIGQMIKKSSKNIFVINE